MLIAAIDLESFILIAIMLGGVLAYITLWCLVCKMLSVLGGWSAMAKRFPRTAAPTGKRFAMQSGALGLANYNNCLTIHVNGQGIDFAVWPIFCIGHRPVFVPWTELNNPQVKSFLWFSYVRIDVGSPKVATITVSGKVFSAFKELL